MTPFDERGEIDLPAHRHNLDSLAERGIEGFLIAGSTGEGSFLEPGERALLAKTAREVVPDAHLMVGVWGESVRQALAQAEEAATGGADGVLVVTPTTFPRTSPADQERFFSAVAAASPLPVMLYSVPRNTGYALAEDVVARLGRAMTVVGMKDSGGDAVRIQRMLAHLSHDFRLFNGASVSITLAMAAGGYGAITASTNYVPELVAEVVASAAHDTAEALPIQHRLTAIAEQIERFGIAGVKAAATATGLRAGLPRPPLAPVDEDTRRIISQSMAEFDR